MKSIIIYKVFLYSAGPTFDDCMEYRFGPKESRL